MRLAGYRSLTPFSSGSDGFAPKFVIANSSTEGTTVFQIDTLKIKPRVLSGGNLKAYPQDAYLTTDRDIYRQSDKVNFFGVVRDLSLRANCKYACKIHFEEGIWRRGLFL
jgi:uncharacterized protein YfaS (alpha-2-macroglobulin family)